TVVQSVTDGNSFQKSSVAYVVSGFSGAATVRVNLDASVCCRAMIVHELHGVDPASPLDVHAGQIQSSPGTAPDAVTSGGVMRSAARDYIFGATSNSNGVTMMTITGGHGETLRESFKIPNGNTTASEDRIQLAPASAASTFTFSNNGPALTLEMAF